MIYTVCLGQILFLGVLFFLAGLMAGMILTCVIVDGYDNQRAARNGRSLHYKKPTERRSINGNKVKEPEDQEG